MSVEINGETAAICCSYGGSIEDNMMGSAMRTSSC